MKPQENKPVGYCCAYTPPFLIRAAGFTPFRVLPVGKSPDQAGQLLHDNLCPHVKRILDRGLSNDLPDLSGMIFINSCDSMRRLSDAWKTSRPDDKTIVLELPSTKGERSITFYGDELSRLCETLAEWNDRSISDEDILEGIEIHNALVEKISALQRTVGQGQMPDGSRKLQEIYNFASTHSVEEAMIRIDGLLEEKREDIEGSDIVPIFISGNVLPDVEAFKLFESSGAAIVNDDLCTGSRMFSKLAISGSGNIFQSISRAIYSSPPCARTFDISDPGAIANEILSRANAAGAKGVILHTMKFCDPYLARIPYIRDHLREASMPFLVIEGDCTMGSMGQQQTRIEAFVEMLR